MDWKAYIEIESSGMTCNKEYISIEDLYEEFKERLIEELKVVGLAMDTIYPKYTLNGRLINKETEEKNENRYENK